MRHRIRRFLQTPKGLLTVIMAALVTMAAPGQGRAAAAGLGAAIGVAAAVDVLILRWRKRRWEYPSGAVLTAAIVAMVLRAQEPWYVTAATALLAIASKWAFRASGANVFNPAALAMIASYYLFHAGQSWWGAQTDVNGLAKMVMIGAGIFITNRVNKMPLVLAYLAAYFLLFTGAAFLGNALSVAEIFRTPDLEAVLYFALFILTDPPTSPTKYREQVLCGVLVAAVSFALFQKTGAVYYLLAGVVAGNAWEAWRRARYRNHGMIAMRTATLTLLLVIRPWA
jgi:Na+-translocating ferredoxin:NAD+ oxidoreductase RnfD subunit